MSIQRSHSSAFRVRSSLPSVYSLSAEEKLLVMEALDHVYVSKRYREMGSCSVCKKISIRKCSGCKTFYCSSECQTFDWPKHRVICPKQRDVLSDRGSFASFRGMRDSSVKNSREEPLMMTDRDSPFIALANQLKKNRGNVINGSKTLTNFKIGNKQYQKKEQSVKLDSRSNISNNGKVNTSPRKSTSSKKSSPEEKKASVKRKNWKNNKTYTKNLLKSIENIPEGTSLPVSVETQVDLANRGRVEVIATYRESANRYWVMLLEDLRKYEEIQGVLNNECKNYEVVEPKVGLVCGCEFVDEWFRAKILSVTPDVTVHFVDYGNVSNYDANAFRKLPDHLRSTPGLVFQIEFELGTPAKYKTEDLDSLKLTIEETSKTFDGFPRVKIVKGTYGPTEVPLQLAKPPEKIIEGMYGPTEVPLQLAKPPEKKKPESVTSEMKKTAMDTVEANTSGILFFLPGEGKIRYGSIVPDNNRDASESLEKVVSIDSSNSTPINAKEGDLVLVTDGEGNDQRGRVVLKLDSKYFVQLIDCGNVISSEKVYSLPEDLKELMELGVKISMQEIYSPDEVKSLETCFFAVNGEAVSGKWPCVLKNPEAQILADVLLENPKVENTEWQPKYTHLKSGSTVEISAVASPNSLYVRPVDVEMEQKFLDMNMEMIQFAGKAKGYAIPPSTGELCCAKFQEDGCFYRAIISSVEMQKCWVLFVDFGNEQETDLKDIKPLPETLRNVPFFAVKVELRNVPTKPWNNMIKDYIGKLTLENIELTLTYNESLSNGVILREKVSGVVVNEFLERAKDKIAVVPVESQRVQTVRNGEFFLDDDMKYTMLAVGSSCTLAILYLSESEFKASHTFWATPAELDNFNYVNLELSSLICNHCETESTPYEPSYRELCLAEFEGSWYRAVCAGNEGDVFKVFFVDFGNCCELKSGSIRKMNKDFLDAPALAVNCTLNGREQLIGNAELTNKIFGKLIGRINTFIENVTIQKFKKDTFLLDIPEINEMLRC